jgi:DNA-binding response OmpR family regulator
MDLDRSVLSQVPARRASLTARCQRVLVAEDDEETRDLAVTAFAGDGHDVFGLKGEAELVECLEIIARHSLRSPDLIAVGVSMAWHSGIDLVEEIRGAGWTTPLVLMTWSLRGDVRSRVEGIGAAVVVAKPFNVAELRNAARRARTK